MKLSDECDAKKAEYDTAHAQTDHLYNEWQQERDRYSAYIVSSRCFLTCWWNACMVSPEASCLTSTG